MNARGPQVRRKHIYASALETESKTNCRTEAPFGEGYSRTREDKPEI